MHVWYFTHNYDHTLDTYSHNNFSLYDHYDTFGFPFRHRGSKTMQTESVFYVSGDELSDGAVTKDGGHYVVLPRRRVVTGHCTPTQGSTFRETT